MDTHALGYCASGDDCCSLDVDEIVARAVRAQHQFADWDERQIDDVWNVSRNR